MTRIDLQIRKYKSSPIAMGTGFVALDLVEGKMGTFGAAGGSCGNVMAMLSWLGWASSPIGRIGEDAAGSFVSEQYHELGVDTSYLIRDEKISTPIVIQRFTETPDGERTHRFSLSCPDCGGWLPRFRALTIKQAGPVLESDLKPNVFYFDRVTPSSLKLAQWAKDAGAIVLFEPSSVGDETPFQKAVDACHILKFSHDRLGHVPDLATAKSPKMIVETLGQDGLRMRWRGHWSHLPAFSAPIFEDAAGSGDWCSAGLLHAIGGSGALGLSSLKKPDIERGLKFGQALAALNCRFEGARGLMTYMDQKSVNKALLRVAEKKDTVSLLPVPDGRENMPEDLCGLCRPTQGSKAQKHSAA